LADVHGLRKHWPVYGNGAALARELDVEPAYLRAFKSGCRGISQKVARGLGFELRWVRVKVETGKIKEGK
jgi:hypothetical protein